MAKQPSNNKCTVLNVSNLWILTSHHITSLTGTMVDVQVMRTTLKHDNTIYALYLYL